MSINKRQHYIKILTPSYSTDNYGEKLTTWSTYVNAWASISVDLNRKNLLNGNVLDEKELVSFRIEYIEGINLEMRVESNGTIYKILSVINVRKLNWILEIIGAKL